jgi:hypothetical protein
MSMIATTNADGRRAGLLGPPILFAVLLLMAGTGVRAAGPDTSLADAAEKADRTKVRALLKQGIDVNAPQVDGMTALHWAAYRRSEMVILLDAGIMCGQPL